MTLTNLHHHLSSLDGLCLVLQHNNDIDDRFSVLDLWELHGLSALQSGITSTCQRNTTGTSTTSSKSVSGCNSTVFWMFWLVGTVSAQRVVVYHSCMNCACARGTSTVFGIFSMVGTCVSVTRGTFAAVGCRTGVFTTLSTGGA